jgi:hypothetical protein
MTRPALTWLAALPLLGACPPNDDTTTGDPATQGTTTAGTTVQPTSSTTSEPTGPSTDPSGPTTDDAGTTSPATGDTTTGDTTTGDTTTGDPASAIHVLYSLTHPSLPPPTTGDLRHLILTDEGASAPTTLLSPPPGGYLNGNGNLQPSDDDRFLSPQRRWAKIHGQDAMNRYLVWLMDIADGTPGAPALFSPVPDHPVGDLSFAPAEDLVSFSSGPAEGPRNLYVCSFAAGACVDDPSQINPPLPPTGGASLATFAPVGTKLVFSTGSEDPDIEILLGDSAAPGTASLLASFSESFTDYTASFSADAATVYLQVDATTNNQYEYFAVDVGGDVPGPLIPVSPPITPDAFGRFAPDRHAFLWFTGDFITGDLDLYELDGTTVSGPFALNGDNPGHAIVKKRPPWSPDSRYIAFISDHELPGTGALYLVDTSGPKPLQPVKMSAPLSPDSQIQVVDFTPDSQHLVYLTRESDQGDNLYLVAIDAPGAAVRLNNPLPADAYLPDAHRISSDGKRLLYAVETKPPEIRDLFYVDLSGPAPTAPVQINAEDHAFIGQGFSPDGQHAFYLPKVVPDLRALYHVDLRGPAPAAPVRLSAEGESVFSVFILPPAP